MLGELGGKAEVLGAIALAMSHVPDQTLAPLATGTDGQPTTAGPRQGARPRRSRSSSRRAKG